MSKPKTKIKVTKPLGANPEAPVNEIVRHLRQWEMGIINNRLQIIRATTGVVFEMADNDLLGDHSDGITKILDNVLLEIDDLRRKINGETEEEEQERFRKEREQKAA